MRLIECYVENFGTIHETGVSFRSGLNLILKENGTGKSTLAAFIKSMFYGLPATMKRNLDENERKKYQPWQGGNYGGWLAFSTDQKRYRIERFFGLKKSEDRFALYDLDTGLLSHDFTEEIGKELFGVDAGVFERSIWQPQRDLSFSYSSDITAKIGGGEVEDVRLDEKASEILQGQTKLYENRQGHGLIPDLQKEIDAIRFEIDKCEDAMRDQPKVYEDRKRIETELADDNRELEQTRSQIAAEAAAKERMARIEYWQMLRNRREQYAQIAEEAEGHFERGIPSEEDLAFAERLLAETREMRAQAGNAMPLEDVARLSALSERFARTEPDTEMLRDWMQKASKIDSENERIERNRVTLRDLRSFSAEGFENGVPAKSECNAMEDLYYESLDGKDILADRIQRDQQSRRSVQLMGLVLAILLIGAGAILFFIGHEIPGIALVGAGLAEMLAVFIVLHFRENRQVQDYAVMEQEAEEKRQQVEDFLALYGRTEGSIQKRLDDLNDKRETYEKITEDIATLEEQTIVTHAERDEMQAALDDVREPVRGSYAEAVIRVSNAVAQFRALRTARDATRTRMAESSERADRLDEQFRAFRQQFAPDLDGTPEYVLSQLRNRVQRLADARRQLQTAEEELRDYEEQQQIQTLLTQPRPTGVDVAALQRKESELRKDIVILIGQQERNRQEADEIRDQSDRLQLLQFDRVIREEKLAQMKANLDVMRKTESFLKSAYAVLRSKHRELMQTGLKKYASLIADELGDSLSIDSDFSVTAMIHGESREYAHFSRGQRDIFDICTRFALCDALFEHERPFLVLDDPFTNLDDQNLRHALQLLEKLAQDRQILYFVCHSSRAL